MSPLLFVLLWYPVVYVSHFAHELGHALMAWAGGFRVSSFGLGLARPFFVFSWRGCRIYLARASAAAGLTFFHGQRTFPSRGRLAAALAGGVLAQAVLIVAAVGLWWLFPERPTIWLVILVVNGLGVLNFIPFRNRVETAYLPSDGALIWETWRTGTLDTPVAERLNSIRVLRPLREAVGDTVGMKLQLLDAAAAWQEVGCNAQAQVLLAEAEALPADTAPFGRAIAALVRSLVVPDDAGPGGATSALEEAGRAFRALDDEGGLLLVALRRAHLLLGKGEAARASADLDEMAANPLLARWPALRATLLVVRLEAAAAQPPGVGVVELAAQYEILRRRVPSTTRDQAVFSLLGNRCAERREWPEAEAAYRRALAAAQELHRGLAHESDRALFLQSQAGFLAAFADCLRHVDKAEEAGRLGECFQKVDAVELRQRRSALWERLGWLVLLANCTIGVLLVVRQLASWRFFLDDWRATGAIDALAEVARESDARSVGLVVVLTAGALVQIWVRLLLLIAQFLFAACRRRGGLLFFYFALVPWLSWLWFMLMQVLLGP